MAYVTKQNLIDRFGERELIQLTDRVNKPTTTISDVVVQANIDDASSLIDGYLAKLYTLPLSVVPPVLTRYAADIAFYYLHGKAAGEDRESPLVRNYNNAIRWLEQVSKGLVTLDAEGVTPAPAGGGTVKAKNSDRVFTRETLRGA